MIKAVFDTNVLVAAMRSNSGASFRLIGMLGPEAPFRLSVSVPLVLEYEMALKRKSELGDAEVEAIIDYVCQVAERREIHFLWRPFLRDPGDEMVLEIAVGAGVDVLVTHNVRDFAKVEDQFGVRVVTPQTFLSEIEGVKQ